MLNYKNLFTDNGQTVRDKIQLMNRHVVIQNSIPVFFLLSNNTIITFIP